MKANKKVVISTAAFLGVAALIAGGTIAYFTDKDAKENHFTVGAVDISLYESQLHRQNSGRMGDFPALASDPDYCDWIASASVQTTAGNSTLINGSYDNARYCTPNMGTSVGDASNITAVANGHTKASRSWGFTDQQIKDDAATYKAAADTAAPSGYFTRSAANIVPGQWVRKSSYVQNEDESSDAYILIRYMVPTAYADKVEVKIPGTPYEEDVSTDAGHQGYFTAVTYDENTREYTAYDSSAADSMDNYQGYVQTIDNVTYRIYAAVTTDVVNPGEMTFWSPVNTIRLKKDVTNITDSNLNGDFNWGDAIDVKVDAQGIQAKTFSNAIEAINQL